MAGQEYDGQYGGAPPHVRGSDTSKAAAESMLGGKALTLRARVLDVITNSASLGKTCDEIEQQLGGSHQSLSARVKELRNDGLIVDSGARRLTRAKRQAAVYLARQFVPAGYVDPGAPVQSRATMPEPSVDDLRATLALMREFWSERNEAGTAPGQDFVRTMQWIASMVPARCETCKGTGRIEGDGFNDSCPDCANRDKLDAEIASTDGVLCDWTQGCLERAVASRRSVTHGWLPVCEKHREGGAP